ncbi:uncharacterized protein BJ171DRAFT_470927 [Polychytrium aggregatum]|uniref:uncharacterized protein n=1 Tax=Polychytrium aggregatum TaxID=110093 RepID=UPI0022FDB5C8|nr:uncharacterized protein BJ171DRAFT_470927 [Polychytrium aggregatum]KAI9209252.1 hypothetical protein BJ171DRAFT_470927 [Polychytrium aggregatum]
MTRTRALLGAKCVLLDALGWTETVAAAVPPAPTRAVRHGTPPTDKPDARVAGPASMCQGVQVGTLGACLHGGVRDSVWKMDGCIERPSPSVEEDGQEGDQQDSQKDSHAAQTMCDTEHRRDGLHEISTIQCCCSGQKTGRRTRSHKIVAPIDTWLGVPIPTENCRKTKTQ